MYAQYVHDLPRLEISPRCIHVTDHITDIPHHSGENKNAQKKHAAGEDVFLQKWKQRKES